MPSKPLSQQFLNQMDPAYCSIYTLVSILNALSMDPNVRWRGIRRSIINATQNSPLTDWDDVTENKTNQQSKLMDRTKVGYFLVTYFAWHALHTPTTTNRQWALLTTSRPPPTYRFLPGIRCGEIQICPVLGISFRIVQVNDTTRQSNRQIERVDINVPSSRKY